MIREDIFKKYQVNKGIIQFPGEFKGEPLYVPYFWDLGLNGFAENIFDVETDAHWWKFEITEEDKQKFPELGNIKVLVLWKDENGFVWVDTDKKELN